MAIEYVTVDACPDNLAADLAKGNRFTEEDLKLNREKKISDAQMVRLGVQALRPFFSALLTLIGWLVFVQVLRMFVPSVLQLLFWGKVVGSSSILLLGCLWGLIVGFVQSTKLTTLLFLDVMKGETACIEGVVSASETVEESQGLDRFHGEKKSTYRYIVKGEEFEVGEAAYEVLHAKYDRSRHKVRLYFTPRSRMLLSIETI